MKGSFVYEGEGQLHSGDTGALFQKSRPVVSSISTGSELTAAPGLILPGSSKKSW